MAIPRITLKVQESSRLNDLPRELPRIPLEVAERFPQMAEWQAKYQKWWFDFRSILQDQDLTNLLKGTISDLGTFKASTTTALDSLQEQLTALLEQLAALQLQVDQLNIGAINTAISNLQTTVSSLSVQISALTVSVSNNTVSVNNLSILVAGIIALINANSIPTLIYTNQGENPIFPPVVGVSGIFGNQRATNIVDGSWWTWNGFGWSVG